MALQGTIDTFALPDVLRLLGSTNKTGRLTLDGDRGRGEVLVVDGQVNGLALGDDGAFDEHPADEAMFELLRFAEGDFVFATDESARDHSGTPWEVEPLLGSAENIAAEWTEICRVVPSEDAWVSLAAQIPGPEVVIDADRWQLLALVGSGVPVAALRTALAASELQAGRVVRDLHDLGVVEITADAPLGARDVTLSVSAPVAEPAEPDAGTPPSSWFDETESFVESAPSDNGDVAHDTEAVESAVLLDLAPDSELFDDDTSAAEFARHLASLSPKAAQAVAAAARAETVEEREAALAEVASSDDSIDHDLLLRFLGETEA
ncbi:MAG: DUF4388 domain-containing protein [Acidimicrobiales bacterium]|nr:DUF4388 domain-containing protein [Acidimicrobiales bacterium]